MVKQTTSTFNILSDKENIANQPKIIQEIKEDLLENLEAQEKLVNRNDLAHTLSQNRWANETTNLTLFIS